jgi:hypothetical protein
MMTTALTTPDYAAVLLPVAQFKESHDLKLDLEQVGSAGATVVAPAYQAMSLGDTVTLNVKLYFAGEYYDTIKRTRTLTATDIGHPIQWTVQKADLDILFEGDHLEVSYNIVYASPTVPTGSEEQTLYIVDSSTPELLPRPTSRDFEDDSLDPEDHLDGITLSIEPYPGIQVDDYVLLYAVGETRVILAIRVDQTSIDSQKLDIPFGYEWLAANNGNEVSLMYQYARAGGAGSSMASSLLLRKPVNLPPPIIKDVVREGEDDEFKGYLLGRSTTNGLTIDIPSDAVIGANDKVQMVFEGFKPGGHYIADPTLGNPRQFKIPKQYVPANLGKRLYVFYEVTPPGKEPYKSRRFDLQIKDLDSGWPDIQIISPPGSPVSLEKVTDAVTFRLGSWTFMAEGQRVRITAKGALQAGGQGTYDVRPSDAEVVTDDEYNAGKVEAKLPREFLASLKLNEQFDVTVEISFDGGFTYKSLPSISPQLVK